MGERLDIAIIGSGPAGLSAAINAKIRNKKFVLFGSKNLSNKLAKAQKVNNYLGFYGKSGKEVADEFQRHLDAMDISVTEKRVTNIYSMGDYYSILANNEMYEATSVILTTGVNFGKPLKGEEEFLGKGVGYCATCDAPLYRGRTVTIIAYSRQEEAEADFVAEMAAKVYYVPMYKGDVDVNQSVEVIRDTPVEIVGDGKVEKLILSNQEIQTDGVFVMRESVAPGQLLPGLQIEEKSVLVDRKMATNLAGCFAAGDIVGAPYQYIKAAGEGNIAALSAVSYVDAKKKQTELKAQ